MRLKNYKNGQNYEVNGPVYENMETKIWCGTCIISDKKTAFVKILNYGEIENLNTRRELLEMSKQEANTLKKISFCSKRVPAFIDGWNNEKKKQYVIIMEQVPGISLRTWIESHNKEVLEAKDIVVRVNIIEQICEIMRDLTNKNQWLVHRDLKPENIYIDKKGKRRNVYIIDFGCANLNYVRKVGSLNYQAPEQLEMKDSGVKISAAVDMFAIGQIFFELLLGKTPVIGVDYTYKAKEVEWLQVPKLPAYLLDIKGVPSVYETIQRMTAFKAEKRLSYSRTIASLKNVRIG
jgi:serine/threonine protein kinase